MEGFALGGRAEGKGIGSILTARNGDQPRDKSLMEMEERGGGVSACHRPLMGGCDAVTGGEGGDGEEPHRKQAAAIATEAYKAGVAALEAGRAAEARELAEVALRGVPASKPRAMAKARSPSGPLQSLLPPPHSPLSRSPSLLRLTPHPPPPLPFFHLSSSPPSTSPPPIPLPLPRPDLCLLHPRRTTASYPSASCRFTLYGRGPSRSSPPRWRQRARPRTPQPTEAATAQARMRPPQGFPSPLAAPWPRCSSSQGSTGPPARHPRGQPPRRVPMRQRREKLDRLGGAGKRCKLRL